MYSAHFNLGPQKLLIEYLHSFLRDVEEKRYKPFLDDGPQNYSPLRTTYMDVEREIFCEIETEQAQYALDRFKNLQIRMFRLCQYIEHQMVFDHAFHRDDDPDLLGKLQTNHKIFKSMQRDTEKLYDLYDSHWSWLEHQGRVSGYHKVRQDYLYTLYDYNDLVKGDFREATPSETPHFLRALFKSYDQLDIRDRRDLVQIDLDRALRFSKQMRYMYRCLGDGVLQNDTEGKNFIDYSKRTMRSLLAEAQKGITQIEIIEQPSARYISLPEIPLLRVFGPS